MTPKVWADRIIAMALIGVLCSTPAASAIPAAQQPVTSLELEGIAVSAKAGSEHINFSFSAGASRKKEATVDLTRQAKKNLEYFFIGLAVPSEKFWVNLNPSEPNAIIEPVLRDTDLGRVILAADLRLKKDVAALTNPRTSSLGKEYWDKIYAKAEELGIQEQIPLASRVWIVPEEARVYETENGLTIIDSPLKVCLESEYFASGISVTDAKQKALLEYAHDVMRSMAIPLLTRKVNEAPAYADLRAVYRALVLARWYREKFSNTPQSVLRYAAATAIKDSEIDSPYHPEQIYKDYLSSLNKGEYNFSESENGRLDFYLSVITRDYFSGGVDFRRGKVQRLTNSESSGRKKSTVTYVSELVFSPGDMRPLKHAKHTLALRLDKAKDEASGALKQMLAVINSLPGIGSVHPNAYPDSRLSRATLNQL